jgi:predicted Zn-dependent protease
MGRVSEGINKKVTFQGETYMWTGNGWVDSSFIKVSKALERELEMQLGESPLAEEDQIDDVAELIIRAREARENEDYKRAVKLAQRIIKLEPHNHAGVVMLCATYRAMEKPTTALRETERFLPTNNPALLTSRAAAYCDIGHGPEALRTIKQALAKGGGAQAWAVYGRIEAEFPELI